MKATMDITPVDNLKNGKVVDASEITTITYDWNDCVLVFDTTKNANQNVLVANISLYDHHLMLDGKLYKILGMLSK